MKKFIKLFSLITLFVISFNANGQTVTGNCSGGKCLSFSGNTNCGSGIYRFVMVQGTWDVARFKIYINGTRADLAGYTAGDNCNYDAYLDKNIITASNGGTNKTWYIKVNTNTKRIDLSLSDFTCTPPSAPSITTVDITSITINSGSSGGQSISDNGSSITSKGVCWNTTGTPTISDSKTTNGSGTSDFTSSITGLTENTTYYVRAYATNGIGTSYGTVKEFTTSAPLPVDLLYFKAQEQGDDVLLIWETVTEIDNDYFLIEKSTDGLNWYQLTIIGGAGLSTDRITYSYLDKEKCNVCYYRLTQVDFDGTQEVFKNIVISKEGSNFMEISVSPNPISNKVNVTFISPKDGDYSFNIISNDGRVIYSSKLMGVNGINNFIFNTGFLKKGIYNFVITDNNGNSVHQKVVK